MRRRLVLILAVIIAAFTSFGLFPLKSYAQDGENASDGVRLSPKAVNTGIDNGYSQDNEMEKDDPHFGWELGYFYVTGQSQVTNDASRENLVLKNTGDEVKLWFHLDQDISNLNGDETLSISDDKNGYDQRMGVEQTDFGRGTLIIKQTDYQNKGKDIAPYVDYLAAKASKSADTMVQVFEEGDYEVVLDYEILKNTHKPQVEFGPIRVDIDTPLTKSYNNYRICFKFSVRNADCVIYPRDTETGSELPNGSYTQNGFYIDAAESKYLDISVKREVLTEGVDGIALETKMNTRVNGESGKEFKDEGIYTIIASNRETKLDTVKVVYVGASSILKAIAESGKTLEDIIEHQSKVNEKELDDEVYKELVRQVNDKGLFVEDVKTTYLSKEYLENLEYNSRNNVYFGYLLSDIEANLISDKYVFDFDDDGYTTVHAFEDYDDTYDKIAKNVATGGGVILVCATVSAVAPVAGAPAAVTAVFAFATKGAILGGVTGAAFGGTIGTVMGYVATGNPEQALKAGVLQASEEFKWGAVTGAIFGGAEEILELREIRKIPNFRISMSEAAELQKANVPKEIIANLNSMNEFNIYKEAKLVAREMPDGALAYIRDIDLKSVIKGQTNAERIRKGKAPLDPTGKQYELHHIGQNSDSPLAILTRAEHRQGGNDSILHVKTASDVEHGAKWKAARQSFWKDYLDMAQEAGLV